MMDDVDDDVYDDGFLRFGFVVVAEEVLLNLMDVRLMMDDG